LSARTDSAGPAPTAPDVIDGISSMAMRHVLAECIDAYRQSTQQRVHATFVGGVDALRRVQQGEPFDFVVLAADAIHRLAHAHRVEPESRIPLARSEIAVAVASNAPRPDIASGSAVRDAVLRARTIGCSTGPSGAHLMRLLEGWGVARTIASRLVQAPPGIPVGRLIARGDVELGFQQLSELMHEPGIDIVGLLPPDIQSATLFSAAICTASKHPIGTEAFLAYLASATCDAAKRRHGMAPVRGRA